MRSATSPATRLYTVEQIRRVEASYAKTHPEVSLMQLAGEAAARKAAAMVQDGGRVLVLAGHGNNGGDAWVAARALQAAWHAVTVLSLAEPKAAEARKAREDFIRDRGEIVEGWPEGRRFDLIVDGLLGIGLSRPPEGRIGELIDRANASGIAILALDVPSGLDADSGLVSGKAIRAAETITFIGAKAGLFTGDGPDHAGDVHIEALNIDDDTLASEAMLLTPKHVRLLIPQRRKNSHKGTSGSVGIVGGAAGMAGAAALAAHGALLLGAGKVFHGSLSEALEAFDSRHPEIMLRKPRDLVEDKELDALVIGPGMGTGDAAKNLLASALKLPIPLVIDADALNLLATGRALQNALPKREAATLLTPHPGEAARLLGVENRKIAENRIGSALELARRFHSTTILKGAGTVIAFPDGTWCVNGTGNPGLASGGTGDVLAGMLGALIAQGMPVADASRLGVCLHGAAADACVADGIGPIGLTASDVALAARRLINDWAIQATG